MLNSTYFLTLDKLVIHENNDDLERRPLQVNMNVQTDI